MASRHITYPTERLSALSDGVFAIVLTLLVLDLKIPPGVGKEFDSDLVSKIPSFVTWIISFILVARIWIVHHAVVARLARCHIWTLTWNFAVLAFCSLVPFGASLIGEYDWDPHAVIVFAVILALTAASLGLFARHAAREPTLHRDEGAATELHFQWRYHAGVIPLMAIVSIILINIDRRASLLVWFVEPLIAFYVLWLREHRT